MYGGPISESYATGNVTGAEISYVGGLVGMNGTNILNCYATGNVTDNAAADLSIPETCLHDDNQFGYGNETYVGGFVGYSPAWIENCYAIGTVSGCYYVGGFAGKMENNTVINSYSASEIRSGNSAHIGGFAGIGINSKTTLCYWNSSALQNTEGKDAAGIYEYYVLSDTGEILRKKDNTISKTADNMRSEAFVKVLNSYVNKSRESIPWKLMINKNNGYPVINGIGNKAK